VAFASAPVSLAAGAVAGPLTLQLQTGGVADTATADQPVALTTSSPKGGFSTTATGPWSPTLTVTIPAGASSTAFYYTDSLAGTPAITARGVSQVETVVPGPLANLTVTPASASVRAGASQTFSAAGADAYGNAVAVAPAWALSSSTLGRLSTAGGASTVFTGSARAATGKLTASSGGISVAASIIVTRPRPRVAGVGTRMVAGHLVAIARVVAGSQPAAGVPLTLRVRRGSSIVAVVQGRTGANGKLLWRSKKRVPRAVYVARAVIRSRSTASRTQHPAR